MKTLVFRKTGFWKNSGFWENHGYSIQKPCFFRKPQFLLKTTVFSSKPHFCLSLQGDNIETKDHLPKKVTPIFA